MAATLTWIDLTASDRDRMRQVLDLFKEQGTVDEMGLGRLRDALSEALFPGTSTIQTRLRYVLFVPWIYRRLEARSVASSNVSAQLRKAELELIGPLLEHGTSQGVMAASARVALSLGGPARSTGPPSCAGACSCMNGPRVGTMTTSLASCTAPPGKRRRTTRASSSRANLTGIPACRVLRRLSPMRRPLT